MSNQPAMKTSANSLQVFAVILLTIIGIGAFTLSFRALTEMFVASGNPEMVSWIFPIIIDGPILAATVAIFYLASFENKRGEKFYSWSVLALFSAASIILNARHVALNDTRELDVTTSTIMAAAPPVALMFVIHLLAILIHRQKKRSGSTVKATNKDGEIVIGTKKKTDNQILVLVKNHVAKGKAVTASDMMRWTGAPSVQSASYQLGRLRKAHPETFEVKSSPRAVITSPATTTNVEA
jgi:hypothetical protein